MSTCSVTKLMTAFFQQARKYINGVRSKAISMKESALEPLPTASQGLWGAYGKDTLLEEGLILGCSQDARVLPSNLVCF